MFHRYCIGSKFYPPLLLHHPRPWSRSPSPTSALGHPHLPLLTPTCSSFSTRSPSCSRTIHALPMAMNLNPHMTLDHDPRFKTSNLSAMDLPNGLWNGRFATEQWVWPPGNDSFEYTPGAVFEISESDAKMGLHQYPIEETNCTVSPNSSTPFSEQESVVTRVRNKPMPRKGHTKSRRGCFNCKRRKIKCQESQPACGNCEKAGIVCEYPKIVQQQQQMESSIIRQPQATNAAFSMADMRFFHHFIVRAYPHLPVGADAVWTLEIPAFAQEVHLGRPNLSRHHSLTRSV